MKRAFVIAALQVLLAVVLGSIGIYLLSHGYRPR